MMEFTTPPSYGSFTVNVGGIIKDGELLTAGTKGTAEHTGIKQDEVADWPEPTSVKYVWHGKTKDGKSVEATLEGAFGERVDRVDFMAEVPGFVKTIVSAAAGTRPYIYQVRVVGTTLGAALLTAGSTGRRCRSRCRLRASQR